MAIIPSGGGRVRTISINHGLTRFLRTKAFAGGTVVLLRGKGNENIITEIPVPENRPEEWADETEREIDAVASIDAQQNGGFNRYRVHYRDASGDFSDDKITFSREGAETLEDWEERANPRGQMAQMMKMFDGMYRTTVMGAETQMRGLVATIERQAAMIDSLWEKQLETHERMNQLLDGKIEREAQAELDKAKAFALREGVAAAKDLAPIVMASIAGKNGVPPSGQIEFADQMSLNLVNSLDDDQVDRIADLFDANQARALKTLIEINARHREAKERKEKYEPPERPSDLIQQIFESLNGTTAIKVNEILTVPQRTLLLKLGHMYKARVKEAARAKKTEPKSDEKSKSSEPARRSRVI